MQIPCINSQIPNFRSNQRHVVNKKTGEEYWTTTYVFRDDMDWMKFAKYLENKYKNTEKVNILNHACSNGLETMTLIMALMIELKEACLKYFPIKAKDINAKNINLAKSKNPISISSHDKHIMDLVTKKKTNLFFDTEYEVAGNYCYNITPKQILTDNIRFDQGDIFEDVDLLPRKNNVVLCRNMWLYLKPEQQETLMKKLSENLDKTSLVVIGYFDRMQSKVLELMKKYGFKETRVENVFKRIK